MWEDVYFNAYYYFITEFVKAKLHRITQHHHAHNCGSDHFCDYNSRLLTLKVS